MSASLSKTYKDNLINRRSVAWLLEFVPVHVLATLLVVNVSPSRVLPWIVTAVWLAIRDIKTSSWGKRLVKLEVVNETGGSPAPMARVLRNVTLMIPYLPVVEFLVAYFGKDPTMPRIGDLVAKTRIHDLAPDTMGQGNFSGQLVGTLAVAIAIEYFVASSLVG